jgi:hypothetical protein
MWSCQAIIKDSTSPYTRHALFLIFLHIFAPRFIDDKQENKIHLETPFNLNRVL